MKMTWANVYFSVIHFFSRCEEADKGSICRAAGLVLDLDEGCDRNLDAIRASAYVPPPRLSSAHRPGKCQVLWRVFGSSRFPEQEAMLKTLALTFGGDRACTDCAPGAPPTGILQSQVCSGLPRHSGERMHSHCYSTEDFRLEMPSRTRLICGSLYGCQQPRSGTRSENDWAWVMAQLAAGVPANQVVRALIALRPDKQIQQY